MANLPIVGPAYKQDSRSLNTQDCINLFLTIDEQNPARQQQPATALQSTPGTSSLNTFSATAVTRGMIADDDFVYMVVGNTLYEFTVNTTTLAVTSNSRGTLNTTTGEIQMAQSRDYVMIVDGTNGYTYKKSDNTFADITDADYNDTAEIVQYVGGYFFVVKNDTDQIYSSNLTDPTAWEALDFITAERFGDKIVNLATVRGELWALGTEATEIYTDEGSPSNFPFERVEGVDLKIGCGSRRSVLNINDDLYFLDHRGYIVRARGYEIQIISTPAIQAAIEGYSSKTSIAYTFTSLGHEFYCLSFDAAGVDITWCYNINTGQWNELKSSIEFNPDSGTPIENYQRRHLIEHTAQYSFLQLGGSWNDGNLYHISQDYRLDNSQPIIRQRTSAHFFNDFKQIHVGRLELQVETGVGATLSTANGHDPQIMMQYSKDRGRTWSNELWRDLGKLGKYQTRVRWHRLGTSEDWTFRFKISDPVKVTLLEASWEGN